MKYANRKIPIGFCPTCNRPIIYSSNGKDKNDIIVSPTVIPYDEFVKYKQLLPYYRNIAEEGKKIG